VLGQLRNDPSIGARYDAALSHAVRRARLPKTDYFVYYTVLLDEVFVLAVWSARRGRQPKL
jgi:plasmid stabilization system protein ParE